jgi:hypothetical protein
VALRDEGAHRGGQQDEAGSFGGGDGGECGRLRRAGRAVAREEAKVASDQSYRGQSEAIREVAPAAQDIIHKQYRHQNGIDEVERAKNRTKSRMRSKVEHVSGEKINCIKAILVQTELLRATVSEHSNR